jgi:hypothetical protein
VTDRDRLAADLHDAIKVAWHSDGEAAWERGVADRLIALGWGDIAAERERIKREVDGLPQMDVLAGPWPEASVVSAVLLPAVFRIIDGEATDG